MPEKGLSPEHHGELNHLQDIHAGESKIRKLRIAQLREEYANDPLALSQLDVYSGDKDWIAHHKEYRKALLTGDLDKQKELEAWFNTNFPGT